MRRARMRAALAATLALGTVASMPGVAIAHSGARAVPDRAWAGERAGERLSHRRTVRSRRATGTRQRRTHGRGTHREHAPTTTTTTTTAAPANPGPGASPVPTPAIPSAYPDTLWTDPTDSAIEEVAALRASGDSADAAALAPIAAEPEAVWLTDATSGSSANVSAITTAAAAVGELPVLVVYDLPGRDCGQYSAGGAPDAAAYQAVIAGIAAGLGQRPAMVVIEPDALSEMSCLPAAEQASDTQLLRDAVTTLGGDAQARLYVDAGNPGWQSAATEAAALAPIVAGTGAGFSVNVSNFYSPSASVAYGDAISALTGGRHFVIDTSRDGGSVAAGQWCNPAGARLGPDPTLDTGTPLLDAELWIKTPGESDGTCNGGPAAGQFWLAQALSLVGG